MQYVLVTGAYGGMGRKTVELLNAQGFCVFALDRAAGDPEPGVIPLKADLTDEASVQAALDQAQRSLAGPTAPAGGLFLFGVEY